jgi:N-acetylglucosaminyldiphosphoundecaprenol N-acetyl-beta-D-mannosaminyltransferase
MADSFFLLGVKITNISMVELVNEIKEAIKYKKKLNIFFLTPHTINLAYQDLNFRNLLNDNKINCCDGIGIKWMLGLFSNKIKEQLSTDKFAPLLFKVAIENRFSLFILGAKDWVAKKAKKNLEKKYPGLIINGSLSPHILNFDFESNKGIIEELNKSNSDIIMVALGNPKQEIWISNFFRHLNGAVCLVAGGYFDYVSEKVAYAPKWVHKIHFVWIYRLIQEPKRLWKRYLIGNFLFLLRVIKEKL